MKRVHPEFAYQARELEGQIDGILGDPPNRKNYDMMLAALRSEYADGGGIEDLNMMAFALVDALRFTNAKALMAEAGHYEDGDPAAVFACASCEGKEAQAAFDGMTGSYPELARQAIVTAFLHKHPRSWDDDDQSLDQLAANDEGDDDQDEDEGMVSGDFSDMFDQDGE